MKLPYLKKLSVMQEYAEKFGGINLADGTPFGEWEELHNMDFSRYPAVSTVKHRRCEALPVGCTGILIRNDDAVYTVADGIIIGGAKTEIALLEGSKRLVAMGAYIIILPDWIIVNTADTPATYEYADIEISGTGANSCVMEELNFNYVTPNVYIEKILRVRCYSDPEQVGFRAGDIVTVTYTASQDRKERTKTFTIKSIEYEERNSVWLVNMDTTGMDTQRLTLLDDIISPDNPGGSVTGYSYSGAVMRRSAIKNYDFLLEHNNRLWACSSENHEIYCSKLGDPTNWTSFEGVSTDAYAATVGTDGDFTGAAVYNGSVLFFKENCVHIVYGTKPSNFTITTLKLRGVQKGCHGTLCINNGLLYYKAPEGIFRFNGSSSAKADEALGDMTASAVGATVNACGCANDKYVYMLIPDRKAYVYDYLHDVWYTEDGENAEQALCENGCLFAVASQNGEYVSKILLNGNDKTGEICSENAFSCETGWLGRDGAVKKHFSKLRFSVGVNAERGSQVRFAVKLKYTDGGEWTTAYSFDSKNGLPQSGIFTVPVIPMRSDKLKIRIEGETVCGGDESEPLFTLYGIYLLREDGTEIGGEY